MSMLLVNVDTKFSWNRGWFVNVGELIRQLKECDQTAEVFIDDDAFGELEKIETDDGPGVILWSLSPLEVPMTRAEQIDEARDRR